MVREQNIDLLEISQYCFSCKKNKKIALCKDLGSVTNKSYDILYLLNLSPG